MTTTQSCIMEGKASPILRFHASVWIEVHPERNSLSPFICRSSFAIQSGLETIVPIPNPLVQIGQRQELSAIDIQRINQLYECGELITPMCSILNGI